MLKKLLENNLYIKLEKCEFDVTETTFLGYVLSLDVLKVDPAILDWPVPSNIRKYNHLLDCTNIIEFLLRISQKLRYLYINLLGKMFHLSGALINKSLLIN